VTSRNAGGCYWVGKPMRQLSHSSLVRTLVTLVISGCGGPGSGLIGIATSGGGTGNTGGGADVLNFFSQPNTANVGQVMSAVQVGAVDSLGGIDTTFTDGVTVTLGSNSTGAALAGTSTVRAVNGIASFGNLTVDKAGTYTLRATANGATGVTSAPFTITRVTGQ
jgi:hypothetical protein